jgi:hypothetical protein
MTYYYKMLCYWLLCNVGFVCVDTRYILLYKVISFPDHGMYNLLTQNHEYGVYVVPDTVTAT